MDRRSVCSKTAKGLQEATGKTSNLPRDLRNLLKEIDGKVNIEQLLQKLEKIPEPKLIEAMKTLERDGYIRELSSTQSSAPAATTPKPASPPPDDSDADDDLDFTQVFSTASLKSDDSSKQQAEAALKARLEAEARTKAETEAKQKAEALAKVQAEARAKAEVLVKARLEAEAKAKAEAEFYVEDVREPGLTTFVGGSG